MIDVTVECITVDLRVNYRTNVLLMTVVNEISMNGQNIDMPGLLPLGH